MDRKGHRIPRLTVAVLSALTVVALMGLVMLPGVPSSIAHAQAEDLWSAPVNLGTAVNTSAAESRPSLSRDGRQLLFGRTPGPEGSGDIYVSTR